MAVVHVPIPTALITKTSLGRTEAGVHGPEKVLEQFSGSIFSTRIETKATLIHLPISPSLSHCIQWRWVISYTSSFLTMQRAFTSRARSSLLNSSSKLRATSFNLQQQRFAHKVFLLTITKRILLSMYINKNRNSSLASRGGLPSSPVSTHSQKPSRQHWVPKAAMS
jgi:hypothetical protein